MWLEWIVEEGKQLFSDVSMWMQELLFMDEGLEEDVFQESVAPNGDAMEQMMDTIGFLVPMEKTEENPVFQKTIWQEKTEDMPVLEKEHIIVEEIAEEMQTQENNSSLWQIFGAYPEVDTPEGKEPSAVWSEGFSETNWLEGGIEKVPQKSIELEQIQLEEQQTETKSEAEVKEENRRDTVNETKIVENTSTEFDINLLMEAFEKKLWTARQKGGSRLIQR